MASTESSIHGYGKEGGREEGGEKEEEGEGEGEGERKGERERGREEEREGEREGEKGLVHSMSLHHFTTIPSLSSPMATYFDVMKSNDTDR